MASWKVAEGVSHPFPPAEGNEEVFSEPLLEDRSKIWDHIWGQMFTKVSRSADELSADDLIKEIVKDAMKVDIFILFLVYLLNVVVYNILYLFVIGCAQHSSII